MIGVLGVTGRVGGEVARLLAEREVPARALVRRPDDPGLPLPAVYADLADPGSLVSALDGVDRLFLVTPHVADQDLLEAAAVGAAAAAGVQRIVKVSGGAASLGPNGATSTAVAHWRSEQRIEASGLGFAFLRPSFFFQNLLDTVAPVVASAGVLAAPLGHAPIAMVDARDVAASAVAALLDPAPRDGAWQLTGPRPVTFDDLAEHLGVRYLAVRPRMAARAMARRGAHQDEVAHAMRMASYFSSGADAVVTDHVAQLTGTPARPVEAFLAEHRDAFTPATGLARTLSRTRSKEHS
ncbi:MAG: NmrA family NAD(P)-binding protein [Solirubrobacteraceae bacterium]|nr:NmrA family NAD(P)-binding protein [Solirubrobacteraceae bacterium]